MPRYLRDDEFWEAEIDGTRIRTREGRVGSLGVFGETEFDSVEGARTELDERCQDRLADHFTWVDVSLGDPAEARDASTATNAELEQAIEEDLDDVARRNVYADWLQLQGNPRGELSAIQIAAVTAEPSTRELLLARADRILARHAHSLLGPLLPFLSSAEAAERSLEPRWHAGYLDSIRISYWDEIHTCPAEVDEDQLVDVINLLDAVVASPSSRFLRELVIGAADIDNNAWYDDPVAGKPSVLDALIAHPLPTLRSLELGAFDLEEDDVRLSEIALGDVGKVLRHLPHLHHVRISGACQHAETGNFRVEPNPMVLHLGAIELPELRSFTLRTSDLSRYQLTSILEARWPKLERLEVWIGVSQVPDRVTADDARRLLACELPHLRHLAICNCELVDELIDAIAASPLLPRLRTLSLAHGCLSDAGAARIAHHRSAFAHLDLLSLAHNYLSDGAVASVEDVCREVEIGQRLTGAIDPYVAYDQ